MEQWATNGSGHAVHRRKQCKCQCTSSKMKVGMMIHNIWFSRKYSGPSQELYLSKLELINVCYFIDVHPKLHLFCTEKLSYCI